MKDINIGILHLSDFHMSVSNTLTIDRGIEKLCEDMSSLVTQSNSEVKAICITGDLINRGSNSESELQLAEKSIINPLIEAFSLQKEDVFLVPGNHEVNVDSINIFSEEGLSSLLNNSENLEKFVCSMDEDALSRISYFNTYVQNFSGSPILQTPLYTCYTKEYLGLKVGIACINSAWRSSGKGTIERGTMLIGKKAVIDCLDALEKANTNINICLLHHPFDWLRDFDKFDIERSINRFDMVLCGHIHSLDSKTYHSFDGQTIFNTSGKFDLSSDIFNGYSYITINPNNYECDIYLRKYLPHPRNCFEMAVDLVVGGKYSAKLDIKDITQATAYNITQGIRETFINYSNSFFISNLASETSHSFDDVFIMPLLHHKSEYAKGTDKSLNLDEQLRKEKEDKPVSVKDILGKKSNYIIHGRKEIGKTTLLHFLSKQYLENFLEYKCVPVIVDCTKCGHAGHRPIENAICAFFHEFGSTRLEVSVEQVEALCSKGRLIVMFDSYESAMPKLIEKIDAFISKYTDNRYFVSCLEVVEQTFGETKKPQSGKFDELYIQPMTKHQIRLMTQSISGVAPASATDSLLDKTIHCLKHTNLPRTPFVVSLILSLCKENINFAPINEAVVIRDFIEKVLERGNVDDAKTSSYDYTVKEDFLIGLVMYMNESNRYYVNKEEFQNFLFSYHTEKRFDLTDSKFDKIFFDRGILVASGDNIAFRYSCLVEYFLAVGAQRDGDFLNYITTEENYINYRREISLYAGINRADDTVIGLIEKRLQSLIDKCLSMGIQLSDYTIDLDFSLSEEEMDKMIKAARLSEEESDTYTDTEDQSESRTPDTLTKKKIDYDEIAIYQSTLSLYGYLLKNSELIKGTRKTEMLELYIDGMAILLSYILYFLKETIDEKILEMLKEKGGEDKSEIKKQYHELVDGFFKIMLPVVLENVAFDTIGSHKHKSIISESIDKHNSDNPSEVFKKFLLVFLYADLRVPGVMKVLRNFVKTIPNKEFLKVAFFKILYYYQFRYYGDSYNNELENLLADINLQLLNENKRNKARVIGKLKELKQNTPPDMIEG